MEFRVGGACDECYRDGRCRYIEVNPERLSGQPTVRGRRIEARTVAEFINGGPQDIAELRAGYDLTTRQINGVAKCWPRFAEVGPVYTRSGKASAPAQGDGARGVG